MRAKLFAEIQNIYPPIRESMEEQIPFNMEVLVTADRLYFFSPQFKLTKEIVNAVLKKYGYKPNEKVLLKPLVDRKLKKRKVYVIRVVEKPFLCYCSYPDEISLDSSEFYLTKYGAIVFDSGNLQNIEAASSRNEKMVQYESRDSLRKLTPSRRIRNLLDELIVLHINANINIDAHPYRKMDQDFKKTYLEVLLYMGCFNQELSANQMLRLEEIARQFNVTSTWLKEKLVTECLKSKRRERNEKIKSLVRSLKMPDKKVLLTDMLSLDILRRKYNPGKDNILNNIDRLLKIRYSDVIQIKLYLKKIL